MNKLICGRMQQGKTTLAQYLAKKKGVGVIAWDPRSMIDGVVCYGPDELHDAIQDKRFNEGPLVYRFDSHDVNGEFTSLCEVIFPPRFSMGNFTFIVDEAAQLQRSNSIHPSLDRAVRQHPRSVDIIQTTHSLQDWFRSSKDLVSDIYTFQLMGKSLDACIDFTDSDDDVKQLIRKLPVHHYAHWSAVTTKCSVCSNPDSWRPKKKPIKPSVVSNEPLTESIQ